MPVPVYYVVENWAGFWEAVKALDGRCIVKPSDNAGSRGVTLLEGGEKTEEELRRAYDYSKGNSRNGIVMVEEFMSGAEVSVEAMTVNGKTEIISITDKYITPPPYFVEIAHSEPSRLGGEIQERIREVALQAIRAIRLQNGPSHTEIKVTEEGPKVVEIAARLGGDFITSRLVPLSTGVDLVGASVRLAAGEAPDLSAKWQRAAAIHFIQSGKGKLRRLEIGEEIFRMDGVEEAVLYKKAGDTTDGTKSSNDRLGHIITVGRTPEEAMERGRKALERICMEYEE